MFGIDQAHLVKVVVVLHLGLAAATLDLCHLAIHPLNTNVGRGILPGLNPTLPDTVFISFFSVP